MYFRFESDQHIVTSKSSVMKQFYHSTIEAWNNADKLNNTNLSSSFMSSEFSKYDIKITILKEKEFF